MFNMSFFPSLSLSLSLIRSLLLVCPLILLCCEIVKYPGNTNSEIGKANSDFYSVFTQKGKLYIGWHQYQLVFSVAMET